MPILETVLSIYIACECGFILKFNREILKKNYEEHGDSNGHCPWCGKHIMIGKGHDGKWVVM